MRPVAIIAGAGESQRFSRREGSPEPADRKQFRLLDGEPLIFVTTGFFLECERIDSAVVVVPEERVDWTRKGVEKRKWIESVQVVSGGAQRQDSVRRGLKAAGDCDVVVIQDAVRPFVKTSWIEETVRLCRDYDGAIVAVQAQDTLKSVKDGVIRETVERRGVWQAQTPQAFRKDSLAAAFEKGDSRGWDVTDEAQLVERNGGRVVVIEGSPLNLKITSPEDWDLAVSLWRDMKGDPGRNRM